MTRPALEVADILRAQGDHFLDRYRSSFDFQQHKAFRAIERCRTAALGGHVDVCSQCGRREISYNSCRNRNCPKCQTQARQRWLAARERELLPTDYFHVVFTVPHELNVLALNNPRLFYDLLFTASAQTLLEVAADPHHLGAEIGVVSILHTWGQNLLLHPHIHCAIPAGGLSPDHRHWIRARGFFLPVKVLSRVFRGKFLAGLKRLFSSKKLHCAGPSAALADPQLFARLLRRLHRREWVVYAKPAFGGPMQVLRYLGRYTHRVAISNHRLLAFDGEYVTFRWKDYTHGGKQGQMKLRTGEFLRRFFLHVLPKAFVRIRHFGFLANRFRASRVSLGRQLLAQLSRTAATETTAALRENSVWHCPSCGAAMIILQRFTAAELSLCVHFDSS
jgi:Putative transposase/Transposase zinc-binding domain